MKAQRCMVLILAAACVAFLARTVVAQDEGPIKQKGGKSSIPVSVYNDPQDRFSFKAPSAGTVTASGDTVVVHFSDSREVLQKVSAAPDAAIQQTLANLPTPLNKLKEVERSRSLFGGADGVFAVFTGENAQGKDWVVKIAASKWGWVLIEDNIRQRLPGTTEPEIIETSFKLTEAGLADASNVPAQAPAKDLPALTEALPPLDHPVLSPELAQKLARAAEAKRAILASIGAQPALPPTDPAPGAAAQAAAQPAGEPGGLQYSVYSVSHMGVYYRMAVTDFIVLFPDGSAIGALPEQGMDGFNPQAWLQSFARRGPVYNAMARYQMFPDHIELAYSNFTRSYGLPGGGAGSLIPLCQCNGIRFAGVYAWGNLMVQFSPDGTFNDRGALDNLVMKNFGAPRGGQGQYALRLNTLYLSYSDGRQARVSFAAPAEQENTGSFDWIALNQKTGRRVQ